jgi:hypothetical protein
MGGRIGVITEAMEHRLFFEISKNCAAEPLDSHEKMLKSNL